MSLKCRDLKNITSKLIDTVCKNKHEGVRFKKELYILIGAYSTFFLLIKSLDCRKKSLVMFVMIAVFCYIDYRILSKG